MVLGWDPALYTCWIRATHWAACPACKTLKRHLKLWVWSGPWERVPTLLLLFNYAAASTHFCVTEMVCLYEKKRWETIANGSCHMSRPHTLERSSCSQRCRLRVGFQPGLAPSACCAILLLQGLWRCSRTSAYSRLIHHQVPLLKGARCGFSSGWCLGMRPSSLRKGSLVTNYYVWEKGVLVGIVSFAVWQSLEILAYAMDITQDRMSHLYHHPAACTATSPLSKFPTSVLLSLIIYRMGTVTIPIL